MTRVRVASVKSLQRGDNGHSQYFANPVNYPDFTTSISVTPAVWRPFVENMNVFTDYLKKIGFLPALVSNLIAHPQQYQV